MKLEQQVVSLKLAKKLKSLGVKQESIFVWVELNNYGDNWDLHLMSYGDLSEVDVETRNSVSAFTVAELGEMLPAHIWSPDNSLLSEISYSKSDDNGKTVWITGSMSMEEIIISDTEADARAKMLIYLLENKLI